MGGDEVKIRGHVADGFEPVREVFASHFRKGLEKDAQCCAYVGEEKVVDLWASKDNDPNYSANKLALVFSSTKTLTAIMMATLVDQGLVHYEDKISECWPEFSKHGKENVTLQSVLRHESGLARIKTHVKPESMLPDGIRRNELGVCVEEARLKFPDADKYGTDRQYHALSRGIILNEVFRRVHRKRRTVGEALRREVAEPLEIDVHIGLKEEEMERVRQLEAWSYEYVMFNEAWPEMFGSKIERSTLGYLGGIIKAYKIARPRPAFPWDKENKMFSLADFTVWDDPWIKRGEMPSSNGHCSARGLAKLAAVMANGGELGDFRLMSRRTWEAMHGGATKKIDVGQNIPGLSPTIFTRGGLAYFDVYDEESDFVKSIRRLRQGYYGWYGLGGSVFQWHPEEKVGFSYVPTLMAWYDTLNLRGARLQYAVVECARKRRLKMEGEAM